MKLSISIQNKSLIEKNKGFIIGACEDGTSYHNPRKSAYILEIEQNNKNWLETVKKAFLIVYNKKCKIDGKKTGYFRLSCYSKQVYKDLIEIRKNFSKILKKSKYYKVGFLQGIYDAEGSVHNKRLCIRVYSNNKKLILTIKKLLDELFISTGKTYVDKRANVLMLPIYGRQNLKRFKDLINFNHDHKEYRLKTLLRES